MRNFYERRFIPRDFSRDFQFASNFLRSVVDYVPYTRSGESQIRPLVGQIFQAYFNVCAKHFEILLNTVLARGYYDARWRGCETNVKIIDGS